MSNTRPSPQAKYELLLENERSTSNVKRRLAAAVIIVTIVGITCITLYLSWNGMKAVSHGTFLQSMKLKKPWHVVIEPRLDLYGEAFKKMENNSKSSSEFVLAPNMTVDKTVVLDSTSKVRNKLVCYYSLPTDDDLLPRAIDPYLCTHINIASISVVNRTLDPISPAQAEVIKQVVGLKIHNHALKVLVCIGGYSRPGGFNDMVVTHEYRKHFIKQVIAMLLTYSLDGIDLDWEFPAWQGDARERVYFTQLLQEMREEINETKPELLLSVAVASPKPIIDDAYEVSEMARYIDYINLMAYDYHFYVWYLPTTGANAPLYSRSDEHGYFTSLNTNWSASYWVEKGMPKEKIVVGLPTYGHSFKLINEDNHGWSAPASGFGTLGSGGFVKYSQVCWFLSVLGAKYVFDMDSKVPYAYLGQEWISYDDLRSVAYKAEYTVNNGYAGVMVFSLNQDDYEGICDGHTFCLTRQVKIVLMDEPLWQVEKSLAKALSMP